MTRIVPRLDEQEIIACSKKILGEIQEEPNQQVIPSLGDDLELEAKVDISSVDEVERVIHALQNRDISEVVSRREWHHFFAYSLSEHHAFVLSQGSPEVWIKSKRGSTSLQTPLDNLPVLLRQERKITPQHPQYFSVFAEVLRTPYIGTFQKECLDVSFWFNDLSFTLTLSLAHTPEKNQFFQFELEFDGSRINSPIPNLHQVLSEFERVARLVLPVEIQRFTTHQKLEWLLGLKSS